MRPCRWVCIVCDRIESPADTSGRRLVGKGSGVGGTDCAEANDGIVASNRVKATPGTFNWTILAGSTRNAIGVRRRTEIDPSQSLVASVRRSTVVDGVLQNGAIARMANADRMLDLDLQGHTAVVSGSTAGIGFSIATALAQLGASVIITGRTSERVDAAVRKIASDAHSDKIVGVAGDLSTTAGVAALVSRVPQADILVNNLGIFEATPFMNIDDAGWLRFFETNVLSGVRLSRAYLPGMLERDWGRIVFVSSESGVQIPAEMIHYGVTKTAQIALARGLAESVSGSGVTINSVLPGPTRSEGVGTFVAQMAVQQSISEDE